MVYAVRGEEFSITKTSMLINPLIFHANVGRINLGLRKALPDLSATEIQAKWPHTSPACPRHAWT